MRTAHISMAHPQRGVALAFTLVFLLVLTLLGISTLSTTSLEEKMAGNTKDRNLAFESAESALVAAESWISAQLTMPSFPNNASGLYIVTASAPKPNWDLDIWSGSNVVVYPNTPGTTVTGSTLNYINSQPKYIIEEVAQVPTEGGSRRTVQYGNQAGGQKTIYRITARGTGGTDSAVVMVQSNFAK